VSNRFQPRGPFRFPWRLFGGLRTCTQAPNQLTGRGSIRAAAEAQPLARWGVDQRLAELPVWVVTRGGTMDEFDVLREFVGEFRPYAYFDARDDVIIPFVVWVLRDIGEEFDLEVADALENNAEPEVWHELNHRDCFNVFSPAHHAIYYAGALGHPPSSPPRWMALEDFLRSAHHDDGPTAARYANKLLELIATKAGGVTITTPA
jgi:hypothetical protein